MKSPLPLPLIVLALVVALAGPWSIAPASAQDRSDNKLLIRGVPPGFAIKVAQPGAGFPRGPGDLPDPYGTVTAYAPINRQSLVYLWDKANNTYSVIATVFPTSTWPDTELYAPQYARGFPNFGQASPVQPVQPAAPYDQPPYTPGQPGVTIVQPGPAAPSQFGRTTYTVRPGDNLFRIALAYGTTVAALAAANNIANPGLIYSGQVLVIP